MADPKLPMFGSQAKIVIFDGGVRVPGIDGSVLTFSCKEVTTQVRDAIVGRKRKRVQKKVDGYDVDCDVRLSDLSLPNYLKARNDSIEAGTAVQPLAIGLEFTESDASFEGVLISNCEASWEFSNPGQSELLKGKLSIQGEDYGALSL